MSGTTAVFGSVSQYQAPIDVIADIIANNTGKNKRFGIQMIVVINRISAQIRRKKK